MSGGLERARAAAARIGARAALRLAARLAGAMQAELPGVQVVRDGVAVAMIGRRLRDRPALRWPGGVIR